MTDQILTDRETKCCIAVFGMLTAMNIAEKNRPSIIDVMDFARIFHKDGGIQAMFDYIHWAIKHDETVAAIIATCYHDIFGRNEECMDPRTSSYLVKETR